MLGRVGCGHAAKIISKYFPWMGWIVHTHKQNLSGSLDRPQHGILALEGECQAPVAADIYRLMPLKLASAGGAASSQARSCPSET